MHPHLATLKRSLHWSLLMKLSTWTNYRFPFLGVKKFRNSNLYLIDFNKWQGLCVRQSLQIPFEAKRTARPHQILCPILSGSPGASDGTRGEGEQEWIISILQNRTRTYKPTMLSMLYPRDEVIFNSSLQKLLMVVVSLRCTHHVWKDSNAASNFSRCCQARMPQPSRTKTPVLMLIHPFQIQL